MVLRKESWVRTENMFGFLHNTWEWKEVQCWHWHGSLHNVYIYLYLFKELRCTHLFAAFPSYMQTCVEREVRSSFWTETEMFTFRSCHDCHKKHGIIQFHFILTYLCQLHEKLGNKYRTPLKVWKWTCDRIDCLVSLIVIKGVFVMVKCELMLQDFLINSSEEPQKSKWQQ